MVYHQKVIMNKIFIELDSLLFGLCSFCEWDMNCPEEEKENCPVMWAINGANYIEIDENMINQEN